MAKERFTGNKFKYTEDELADRGIGTLMTSTDHQWKEKKDTYTNEGVWNHFTTLRDSFRVLLVDAGGWKHSDKAQYNAQIMMDKFLILRSQGENVKPPTQVVPIHAAPDDEGLEMLDAADFADKKSVSVNIEVRWILDNLKMGGVTASDAPSAAAYALLLDLQKSPEQTREFYRTMLPKLMTKEDTEKGGKLMDTGKKTIELLERLIAGAEEKK